tara:strand:- start:233 stop:511 length:279 start_codon:yes stop_codon:yes gene_type:complete
MLDVKTAFSALERNKLTTKTFKDNCNNKIKYLDENHALEALEKYISSVLFSNMDTYYCKKHNCFHLGHNQRMAKIKVINRSTKTWERIRLAV